MPSKDYGVQNVKKPSHYFVYRCIFHGQWGLGIRSEPTPFLGVQNTKCLGQQNNFCKQKYDFIDCFVNPPSVFCKQAVSSKRTVGKILIYNIG